MAFFLAYTWENNGSDSGGWIDGSIDDITTVGVGLWLEPVVVDSWLEPIVGVVSWLELVVEVNSIIDPMC